jgi:hypothetical protein
MFPEYVAYLAAKECEERLARSALPQAPVEDADAPELPGERLIAFRARISGQLRRLADRLEPTTPRYTSASAHRR